MASASCSRSTPTRNFSARADQASLELPDAAHDRQHQLAGGGRGIAPSLAERDEASSRERATA
jgi:hypothetical protein